MKILLVEDNTELALWLSRVLQDEQFAVDVVHDGESALLQLADAAYDVVLLDLKLPGMDGRGVLRRMRREQQDTPVMVLTASASLDIKVDSLELGADDYLVKPFEVRELVARIKALIRRHGRGNQTTLSCADLHFDLNTREFRIGDLPLALTPREHSVLEALLLQAGKTISKTQLAQTIFGPTDDAGAEAIELYVHRVRRKLEPSRARIATLRGLGYLLREEQLSPTP